MCDKSMGRGICGYIKSKYETVMLVLLVRRHFSHCIFHNCRVMTRAIVIDFNMPIVAPQTDDDEEAFAELEDIVTSGNVSSGHRGRIRGEKGGDCNIFTQVEGFIQWSHL